MSFLILAPPRCMTAWLANLLTEGDTVCHHDAMAFGGLDTLHRLAGPNVGFAETAGMYVPGEIRALFPAAPMVVILADLHRVAASLRGIGVDGEAFVQAYTPRLAAAVEVLAGHALFVRDVEVLERAAEIAVHLTGRAPGEARLRLLRGLQVTQRNPLRGDLRALQALLERDA